ncbi:1-(5-phosphoribosyl)-5-[(5-phosphoribosylamino)methylideneamino]imidazole-4-carboxamide isomerase [Ostreibacterium oceani]|uniref:1-(5-phosphoribosyl)-5-[(5-phosphoribosylamino)methylideneamino] imidazole-4-carboxamide isomerase n=1 Tax=Ostreibacterium oceani TaxID=2654998 RepID=A0A6N7EW27_9GAMM|nr:1-(5-phosphoribosyl)-5-[(5-phosphoribosylamino)methylideneamino]imidazole-4-carboxamide isomerase [Ostreibacterium oceani]MPV86702.1 1-(5-phosphoribosyl)-5-[(5-phosphoribosylamino)methylideneamino]imidazole-4-carboxamide isomerase [Ostreibacterium oceani]
MLPIPAIDLKDQQCVRLKQGRMEDSTVFSDDPVAMAGKWVDAGCERLHLVDLDGAFAGEPVNGEVIANIVKAYPQIPVQIGGGIRSIDTAKRYIDLGVKYVIIGTKAVESPEFVTELCAAYPQHVMVGIDAKNGMVATDGWANVSNVSAIDLAKQFENLGVQAIIYTDIARDGMMQGVNVEQTANLASKVRIPVIASGGVASLADIKALATHPTPIYGAIIGRAIYDGAIDLAEACALAKTLGAQ